MYSRDALEACRQVLNDVVYCLMDYEDRFYLIGGWAIYYLLDRPDRTPEAVGFAGTEDVDLAFLIPMVELERIMERLEEKGYQRSASQRLRREVSGRIVIVDLLGGKQEVKDSFTFKRRISGPTLAGDVIEAEINVANLPACLVLKANAFDENPKDKDAYDIYYLVTHGGTKDGDAAREVKEVLSYPFVAEGVKVLHLHFGRVEGKGLRAATQMLGRLEGRSAKEARSMVRGSFSRFFTGIGMAVNF
ncbi:MAG: nucleotidyl transferase AbiEii/AbiGii toxin family protein [Deltaproteobacteria bacterium]|nr:nucleotidyl transferase AbiEii/AbiGii toxin family protein [Deltaproteobacteria bacterium]